MTRSFLTLSYLPLGLAGGVIAATFTFLIYVSGEQRTVIAFRRAQKVWLIAVLWGGLAAAAAGLHRAISLHWSGDQACAFLLVNVFLGVLFPLYAAFGLIAWLSPKTWQRIIERRDAARHGLRSAK